MGSGKLNCRTGWATPMNFGVRQQRVSVSTLQLIGVQMEVHAKQAEELGYM